MQEIFEKLKNLIGICETKIKKVDMLRSELGGQKATQDAKDAELDKREKDLDERQIQIESAEYIGKTIDEATALRKEAARLKESLEKQIAEITASRKKSDNEIANQNKILEEQRDKIAKDRQAIEVLRQNYKKEVLEEIKKQTEKKQ